MNESERAVMLERLAQTRDEFQQSASGLSEQQARFKPSPDRWSVEEIVEHVAVAEHGMYRFVSELHEASDDPHEAESAASLARVGDRKRTPLPAPERACPKGRFGSLTAALNQFLENRQRTIEFVSDCRDDLRLRLIRHPVGLLNAWDCLSLMTYHPERHVEQIEEVKAHSGFPAHYDKQRD